MKQDLLRAWAETEADLERARDLLGIAVEASALRSFSEFLAVNELELALDELEVLGAEAQCPPDFWRALLSAANRMGLTQHAARLSVALRHSEELAV